MPACYQRAQTVVSVGTVPSCPSGPLDSSSCAPSGSATGRSPRLARTSVRSRPVSAGVTAKATTSSGQPSTQVSDAGAERAVAPGGEQRPVQLERRALDALLLVHGQGGVARRLRQPGLVRRAEAAATGRPRPTASAPGSRRGRARCARSAPSVGSWRWLVGHVGRVRQAELLALVEVGRARQREHQRGRGAGAAQAERRRPAAGRRCRCRWGGGCRRAARAGRRGGRRRGWTAPTWWARRRSRWPRSEDSTTARRSAAPARPPAGSRS